MAYSTSNPPRLISQSVGASAGSVWLYLSTDADTEVDTDGYFSNGWDLGMRANDVVIAIDTDATHKDLSIHVVKSASATGGVNLSDDSIVAAGTPADTD